MTNVLLSFCGPDDPFHPGLLDGDQVPGSLLGQLYAATYQRLVLFDAPFLQTDVQSVKAAVEHRFPNLSIESVPIPDCNGGQVTPLLEALRSELSRLRERSTGEERYFVNSSSGNPQTEAVWILLTSTGEFPASRLEVQPFRHVTLKVPQVRQLDSLPPDKAFKAAQPESLFDPSGSAEGEEDLPDWSRAGPYAGDTRADFDPESDVDIEALIEELGIIGDHPRFRNALNVAATLARHSSPMLLQGETGTGKDLFARFIHRLSPRAQRPLITVNCATLPDSLAESILFGHRRGSFTGASQNQMGKFEAAHGGTLFLDELGELSHKVQAKLLRVIEDGLIDPLGSSNPIKVNVRLIAATNRDLQQEVVQGFFREDLYYRLRIGEIWLPPLRERRQDIPKLALYTLDRINRSIRNDKRFARESIEYLQRQSWPGNIRDLQNVIERAAMLSRKKVLEPADLNHHPAIDVRYSAEAGLPSLKEGFSIEKYLGNLRRRIIIQALEQAEGNQSEAARLLGISPQAVHKFIKTQSASGELIGVIRRR